MMQPVIGAVASAGGLGAVSSTGSLGAAGLQCLAVSVQFGADWHAMIAWSPCTVQWPPTAVLPPSMLWYEATGLNAAGQYVPQEFVTLHNNIWLRPQTIRRGGKQAGWKVVSRETPRQCHLLGDNSSSDMLNEEA